MHVLGLIEVIKLFFVAHFGETRRKLRSHVLGQVKLYDCIRRQCQHSVKEKDHDQVNAKAANVGNLAPIAHLLPPILFIFLIDQTGKEVLVQARQVVHTILDELSLLIALLPLFFG